MISSTNRSFAIRSATDSIRLKKYIKPELGPWPKSSVLFILNGHEALVCQVEHLQSWYKDYQHLDINLAIALSAKDAQDAPGAYWTPPSTQPPHCRWAIYNLKYVLEVSEHEANATDIER